MKSNNNLEDLSPNNDKDEARKVPFQFFTDALTPPIPAYDAAKFIENLENEQRCCQKALFAYWFHWTFVIIFSFSIDGWVAFRSWTEECSSCDNTYNLSVYVIAILYLVSIQVYELWMFWSFEPFWEWARSKTKFGIKRCRVTCWQLPFFLDMLTAALSRADLITDISFISIAIKCCQKDLAAWSFAVFWVSIFLFQFFCTMWGCSPDDPMVSFNLNTRGSDMVLSYRFASSMHFDEIEQSCFCCNSASGVCDAIVSFVKFLLEDCAQTAIQIIFLLRQEEVFSKSSDWFVLSSILIAFAVSFIRVVTTFKVLEHREGCGATFFTCCIMYGCGCPKCCVEWIAKSHPSLGIQLASGHGYSTAVELSLKQGANIEHPCSGLDPRSPLMLASDRGRLQCVKLLLLHRANINNTDEDGISAMDLAKYNGHDEIVSYLNGCMNAV